ncbi:MAG: hypothetical protein IPJ41_05650 [Phycisphaerales bacterium]|nr:hypothetical protein [Phycisphaerales bacterium]
MKMKTRVLGILCAVGTLSTAALAIPPALDHVASTFPVVIGVRDVGHLGEAMKHWTSVFGGADAQQGLMVVDSIMNMDGINAVGSAAIALNFEAGSEQPTPVVVIPVSNFSDFVEGLQGHAGDGVVAIQIMGDTGYAKDIGGGFAAMGPDLDAVTAFDGKAGRLKSHETRLGKTATTAADKDDLFVIADVQTLRPMLEQGIQQMEQGMSMAAMMGGEAVQAQMELMTNAAKSIVNDGKTAFLGMGSDDAGIWLDFAAQFTDGTETSKVFADQGNAASLFSNLPAMDYIAAFAFDTSSPGIRDIMTQAAKLNQGMGFGSSMTKLAGQSEGQALVIGTTPGLFAGGLFSNTLAFSASKHPDALLDSLKQLITGMDGQTQQGLKFTSSFKENVSTIGSTPVHAYGVAMEVDPNDSNAMMASMAIQQMTMIFGGEAGPKGFVATNDKGLYQTMSRNTELMTRALNGEGDNMAASASIASVADHLPEHRTMEAYVNVKGVLDMVGPLMSMMGGPTLDNIPENLHPLGMSLSTGAGGMHSRIFLPADFLDLVASMKSQFGGGEGDWEDVEDEPKSKPRF